MNKSAFIKYLDTQVKYDTDYTYKIYKYDIVQGYKYKLSDTVVTRQLAKTDSSDSTDTGDSSTTEDTSSESDSYDSTDTTETTSEIAEEGVPAIFNKIYAASRIYLDGSFVVIKVNGAPDHKSPYYSSNSNLYEAYNGTNTAFSLNPKGIPKFLISFRFSS